MEPLSFKEQIKVYASSQVLIMTHGAALVNILFMPEVGFLMLCHTFLFDKSFSYIPFLSPKS